MAADQTIIPDINEELVRHLQEHNEVVMVSAIFAKLETNKQRVSFAYDLLKDINLLPRLLIDSKSNAKSQEYRKKGNDMFIKQKCKEAHEFYTKSIAFAEPGTEDLALAYANRSAVLFEKRLYNDCLRDIQLALENNYPEHLKSKLVTRNANCERLLASCKTVTFFTPIPEIPERDCNALIQSAANSVKIEYTETLGRHIVATRDIEPGEIIAVEKAFCHVLIDKFVEYCQHCLKLCYSLIPCPNCTQALFCSTSCQSKANSHYHQYECPVLRTAKELDFHKLLHLKMCIVAREKYKILDQCSLKSTEIYRSDRYDEIHNLVANTSSRSVSDLFNRAVSAAVFYHLMREHTRFFHNQTEDFEDTFKELLLFYMQSGPCNFHELTARKSTTPNEASEIGAAAFSFLSLFNHSCFPNVTRYSYGPTAVVITIKSIHKGEQCFDNYGQHHALMSRADRRAKLKKQYFFDCNCVACVNDYPLYDSLPAICESSKSTIKTFEMLKAPNLKVARKVYSKLVDEIKKVENKMPNRNLGELQEALKECCFVFSTLKTPI